jgi:hypothetical protein
VSKRWRKDRPAVLEEFDLALVGFAAVLLTGSILVLAGAIRFGQRRGTIIEY